MAKAKKLPSGSWRVQVYLGKDAQGKRIVRSVTAPTRKEAEFLASELRMQETAPSAASAARLTVGAAIDSYIAGKDGILSPSTIQGYRKHRKTRFTELMQMPIDKVTARQLQLAVNAESKFISRRGTLISAKTVGDAFALVSAALHTFRPHFVFSVTLPKKIKKIKTLPEPEAVLSAIRGTSIELPAMLAMWLSFSMSELRGIRWSSIQETRGTGYITIENAIVDINGVPVEKIATKVDTRTRRLQIPAYILNLIHQADHSSDYLITLSGQAIYKRFVRIIEAAGLPHMTFHDLRHMSASVMALLAIPDKYAMERGGWKTDKVMKGVYQHTFGLERQAVDQKIDAYFNELLEKSSHESSHENKKTAL